MAEQRYKAVEAVIGDGRTVTPVAREWNVSRQTLHEWLARYEREGLEGLSNGSHRPAHCPHQMSAAVEVQLLEMRRARPYWGARRLALERPRLAELQRIFVGREGDVSRRKRWEPMALAEPADETPLPRRSPGRRPQPNNQVARASDHIRPPPYARSVQPGHLGGRALLGTRARSRV